MHKIITDLGFGDSGKGTTVDSLARRDEIHTVIRYNGGAQAAHHVVLPDGRTHRFSQFGSGTLQGAPTHHSRFMMVDPIRLENESIVLRERFGIDYPLDMVSIDERSLVTTPYHAFANKLDEAHRQNLGCAHGSCGVGIGKTVELAQTHPGLALRWSDLSDRLRTRDALSQLWVWLKQEYGEIASAWRRLLDIPDPGALMEDYIRIARNVQTHSGEDTSRLLRTYPCAFEGSQGVLLDEWYGFHPHTTWSTCTPENAIKILDEAGQDRGDCEILGVMRSYTTRHGAGPFPTEDPELGPLFPEPHNGTGKFQGAWRTGHLDLVALKYAVDVVGQHGGLDGLVVTHCDRLPAKACVSYRHGDLRYELTAPLISEREDLDAREFVTEDLFGVTPQYTRVDGLRHLSALIEDELDTKIVGRSFGPTWQDKGWS